MTVFTQIAGRMSAPRNHIQTLTKQRWEITGSPELSKLLGDRANCKEGEAEILRAPVLFELLQRRPSARTRPAASPSTHWRAPGINDRAIADAACARSAPPKEGDTQCSTCLSQNVKPSGCLGGNGAKLLPNKLESSANGGCIAQGHVSKPTCPVFFSVRQVHFPAQHAS